MPANSGEFGRKDCGIYRHPPLTAPAMHVHPVAVADRRAEGGDDDGGSREPWLGLSRRLRFLGNVGFMDLRLNIQIYG